MSEGSDVVQDLNQVLSAELTGSTARSHERRQSDLAHRRLLSISMSPSSTRSPRTPPPPC